MDKFKMIFRAEVRRMIAPCGAVFCVFFRDKQAFEFPSETYDHYTVFALLSGGFSYRVGDGAWQRLGPGDAVICPPGEAFARKMLAPSGFALLKYLPDTPPAHCGVTLHPASPGRFREDLEALEAGRWYADFDAYPLRMPRRAADFAQHPYMRHIADDLWFLLTAGAPQPPSGEDPALAQAHHRIEVEFASPLRIGELARDAGYSETHFINLYRCRYGVTPKEALISRRIGEAQRLLWETDASVNEIALRCGCGDGMYLSRLFARRIGITPTAYRKLGSV